MNVSINENANVDPSQVEDMRGQTGGGGGGGFNFPGLGSGGGGGGGGGGMGGLGAGAGCLSAFLPMFKKNPKLGCAIVIILALCIGGFLCFGGGGQLGNLGNVGGLGGGGTAPQPGDNTDLQKACDVSNPERFQRTDCRNLLYINSVQAYWQQAMPQYFGTPYQKATTRYFSGGVNTACGSASSGMGPFYCPGDNHVYIDLAFYDELARRFGASGQFAQAYVLAHEYGHHVQTLLGTEAEVRRAQQRDPANANRYSVAMELQADCFAGTWANAASRTTDATGQPLFTSITQKDIDEALQAAAAVGDDTIQKRATGTINESGFTHGSAQQRQQWFNQGFTTGDPRQCNTFGS
uniref:KPN_02809 family neutral zinc metallopeptidase n=1 Tax=Catelliglobosispora koreensis TaxID=129052 RepID=UPI00035DE77D|nr:neutral zinc metallopeptidase [Catelliglobosispora koreensis]